MAKMFRTWLAAPALRVVFSPHPQNRAAMGRWGWFCHRNNDKSHSGHRPPPVRSALRELHDDGHSHSRRNPCARCVALTGWPSTAVPSELDGG